MAINVGNSLHKIRDKLPSEEDKKIEQPEESSPPDNGGAPQPRRSATEKEIKKSQLRRQDEFIKVRRDVISRLNESLAVIPDRIDQQRDQLNALEGAEAKFHELLEELEKLDPSQWSDEEFASEMTSAMRKVENTRLEYIRTSAKLEQKSDSGSGGAAGIHSIIHELNSLTFGQWFKAGLGFSMPLVIAIIAAGLIVFLAIGVWMKL